MESREMVYVAACVATRYGRAGVVLHGYNLAQVINIAENLKGKIGYVAGDTFAVAVKRAGMMERNEPGAWGPL